MATHHSSLAWRIPWTGEPVRGVEKSQTWLKQLSMHLQASVCEQQTAVGLRELGIICIWGFRWTVSWLPEAAVARGLGRGFALLAGL